MSDDPLHRIFQMLGEIKADQTSMKSDISEIKDGFADYNNFKNKIIGVCVGVSAVIGGGLNLILKKLGISA